MNKEQKKTQDTKMMNPFKDFDPEDFEPLASKEEKGFCYRKRVAPPKELPTFGIKPKQILEGQMIGMYESKQDLYLIMAHRCNDLQKQIDALTEEINKLKNK